MSKHSLSEIKTKYKSLTAKEKQLADFVLDNPEKAVKMSVSELAQAAGVVKSLVIRFCQSLGFSGYTEFRLSLSGELARNVQFNYIPYISPTDNSTDILDKVFSANIKTKYLTVGVSTGGMAPGATSIIRDRIKKEIPENIDGVIDNIAEIRNRAKEEIEDPAIRRKHLREKTKELLK